jgi:hypothetical protein
VPITSYYTGTSNTDLKDLIPYLKHLAKCEDVREENRKAFKLRELVDQESEGESESEWSEEDD